jgi:hypothetical protein
MQSFHGVALIRIDPEPRILRRSMLSLVFSMALAPLLGRPHCKFIVIYNDLLRRGSAGRCAAATGIAPALSGCGTAR